MKRMMLVAVVSCAVAGAGCHNPVAPAPVPETRVESPRSNVPAQLPNGLFVCSTQPRMYCNAANTACWWEADVYTQTDPCPLTPIK